MQHGHLMTKIYKQHQWSIEAPQRSCSRWCEIPRILPTYLWLRATSTI